MRFPQILPAFLCVLLSSQMLQAQNIDVDVNGSNEILFHDNGQIRSLDNNHRILFRRSDNALELREFGRIIFSSGSLTGLETAKMVLLDNGNLGIGVGVPTATFHINATNQAAGDDAVIFDKSRFPGAHANRYTFNNVGGLISETPGPFWRGFHIASPYITVNGGAVYPRVAIYAEYDKYDDPTIRRWVFNAGNATPGSLHDIQFKAEDVELLYLKSNGNVGIGTSTPQTKLAVNGDVTCKKVTVTLTGWPDYVFHTNYRLRPLSEVEQYINQYHHLPEVVSAEEVAKNGLDIGDNQAALLKKIEELTLYVIEQDKQIKQLDTLKKEVEELKAVIREMKK